ncbi:MAG: hypothetical protein GY796_11615 [Chloroflexi bacterium]|nr:hypothetical protein [Chloroflexota bacterium]
MSHEISCKECGFQNPSGSKFCSNCGSKLPLSTHIICENCGTSNPIDRIFCDHCGTRLLPEEPLTDEKTPPEEPASGAKPFSLPTRKPGETGDLDPGKVPDWLKTGRTPEGEPEAEDETDSEALPRLEDLTRKKQTDELPDWLIPNTDSDPIIHAPTIISTEFYLDMIQGSESESQPSLDDLDDEESDLPDWLSVVNTEQPANPSPSQIEGETAAGLTDWLSELPEEDDVSKRDDAAADSLTSWLSDWPDETETAAAKAEDEDSLTDWLSESTDETDALSLQQQDDDSLTDWLSKSTGETDTLKPQSDADDSLTNWLSDRPDEDENGVVSAAITDSFEGLTDWLDDEDDFTDTAESGTEEDFMASRLNDWLATSPESEEPASEPLTDEPLTGEPPTKDLLADETLTDETRKPTGFTDWFAQNEVGDTEEAKEDQFDWLGKPEEPTPAATVDSDNLAWLDDSEAELSSIFQNQKTIEEEMPDWLAGVAEDGDTLIMSAADTPDSLDDAFSKEEEAAKTEIDWLRETGSLALDDDLAGQMDIMDSEAQLVDQQAILSDEPAWLADLAAFDTGQLIEQVDEEDEPELDDDFVEELATAEEPEPLPDTAVAPPADHTEEDWESEEPFAALQPVDEGLPDWLNQLDPDQEIGSDLDSEEPDLIPSEGIPEWVASMRPSDAGSIQSDHISSDDLAETLAGVPEELVGADLPDWLQDVPLSEQTSQTEMSGLEARIDKSDIPGWLQEGLDLDDESEDFLDDSADLLEPAAGGDEWGTMLSDLPPSVPIEQTLAKADIPDWMMPLKPVELGGEKPEPDPEATGPEQTSGPLSGLRGVVEIESVIALAHAANPIQQFTVSPEQQQQVSLLRQLSSNGHETETIQAKKGTRDISSWFRPLFALILMVVIGLGLRGQILVDIPTVVPAAMSGVNTAVTAATGETVLVAFEYTPAMAGELTPEADLLLSQLSGNGSTILTLSQYTAGTAVAKNVTAPYTTSNLGYLPGGPAGLRHLGECFAQETACQNLFNQPLSASDQEELANVALVLVVTANRESLVNWVEQVGTSGNVPLVAGVTQSLAPIASPYFAAGQLQGVLNGVPATAVYQQTYNINTQTTDLQNLFNAQLMAQMLLIVVLILGAIIYIIIGFIATRKVK